MSGDEKVGEPLQLPNLETKEQPRQSREEFTTLSPLPEWLAEKDPKLVQKQAEAEKALGELWDFMHGSQ